MTDAAELMRDIRESLWDLDARLLDHPFLTALERGELREEALRSIAALWEQAIVSDLRAAAMMVQRFGHTAARDFLNGVLQIEFAALDGLRPMLQKFGLSREEVARYEPSFEGMAFSLQMAWLAAFGSAAEFAVMLLASGPTWEANCARMGRALRARYGFTEQETAFLERELGAEVFSMEKFALPIIQEGLDEGVEPHRLFRAARYAVVSVTMLWDAMLAANQPGAHEQAGAGWT
ncbi:hypothetical protein HPC49_01290 [Pyxidicoccus fallax]|uniref:Thiaminase-2/PQQC domain-containing protein n=1 Tax=Pyxidicoccus fallax TaxID=394095 RepID=A0A848L8P6_9BACT|nr:hypothetical protein [Pyxidicoccus fallax]NMO15189.1 hypothetical protein [Pyxidicoccus fallax]NPC76888.1 hypothetical protein [Pyxidicoccus fallax]